jgi:hypothetical protein
MLGYVAFVFDGMLAVVATPEQRAEIHARAGIGEHALPLRMDRDLDDALLPAMLDATGTVLGLTRDELLETHARHFIADAVERFPRFFSKSPTAIDFLQNQPLMHCLMSAAIRDPKQRETIGKRMRTERIEGGLRTHYASPHRLGRLYMALARAALAHYGERATVIALDDPDGETCRFEIRWPAVH